MAADGSATAQGASPELARLHVSRAVERIDIDRVVARAERSATVAAMVGLILGASALGLAATYGRSLFEGADVLLAVRSRAPIAVSWLDDVDVTLRMPEYLHGEETALSGIAQTLAVPYGTTITIRGFAHFRGRRLVLAVGASEIAFGPDGSGAWTAHVLAANNGTIRVGARFGDVVIFEREGMNLEVIMDEPPRVTLDGAPREVRLAEVNEAIALHYEATDDHGLRDVELVLRAGNREERRELARLDGETASFSGATLLSVRDPFLRSARVAVDVVIEARDSDPLLGPKWGSSAAMVFVPPEIGEPEGRRIAALRELRDTLVDTLAWRLPRQVPKVGAKTWALQDRGRSSSDRARMTEVLAKRFSGLATPSRVRNVLIAAEQRMNRALDVEIRSPSSATRSRVVDETERMVLVADAVVETLASHDARHIARELVDAVDDLALGAALAQTEETRARGDQRMDASAPVIRAGGREMTQLGMLGRDLGETIGSAMLRVDRARTGSDFVHAELAARDLASRLRQPDPSFVRRGGRSMRAGSESGGSGGPGATEKADEIDQAAAAAEQELERLTSEHGSQVSKTEQTLSGALDSDEEKQEQREEASRHAERVRRATEQLPRIGDGSDSWTAKGAAAREHAEQMARSLESGRIGEAAAGGQRAVGALDEAKRALDVGGWRASREAAKRLESARKTIDEEQKWAESAERESRRRSAQRVKDPLAKLGDSEEAMGGRARSLAEKAGEASSLPDQVIDSIESAERAARRAADSLRQGEGEGGLAKQRDAQRALEAANETLRGDSEESSASAQAGERGGAAAGENVAIPSSADHKTPEAFRRRVVRGLGSGSNSNLRDALRRYAEGLLR
jgi:hypothetical protein